MKRVIMRILLLSALFVCLAFTFIIAAEQEDSSPNEGATWREDVLANPDQAKLIIHQHGGDWCNTQHVWDDKMAALKDPNDPNLPCPSQGSCDSPTIRDTWLIQPYDEVYWVRLRFVVIANNDGSNPAATQVEVDGQFDRIQEDYAQFGIQFLYETIFVNSTSLRTFNNFEEFTMKSSHGADYSTKLNIYVTNIDEGYIGVGTFPWDSDATNVMDGIIVDETAFGPNDATLTHELGHCFGLWHTFHGVEEVGACGGCYEEPNMAPATADIRGDFCSDTDPTPTNFSCSPPGGNDACSGQPWGDTDVQNYMGYSSDFCQTEFSPQQWARLRCWLNDERSTQINQDVDSDGILNKDDNCPTTPNFAQTDVDADTVGDACDNCVSTPNRDQLDADTDDIGDVCDVCTDTDGDTYGNPGFAANTCPDDNCPDDANLDQSDVDADTVGDVCDNCPNDFNPLQESEFDNDAGDLCDGLVHIHSNPVLPEGYNGAPYTFTFEAVGAVEPYSWVHIGGDLPFGCVFNGGTVGTLTGTPNWNANYFFTLVVEDNSGVPVKDTINCVILITDPIAPPCVCGDADDSESVDISDAVYLIAFIFGGGPAPDPMEAGDPDCSGGVDISDAVYLIAFIFGGGPAPCVTCPGQCN